MRPRIIIGDAIAAMRQMDEATVSAIVTDPPYGLGFMGKAWDDLPPGEEWARECLRVLKPGGHLLAFGGTRTWHRLAVAVEDAGFEIRDSIAWMYGSGFPKSPTVLKPAHEPIVVARKPLAGTVAANILAHGTGALNIDACRIEGAPWTFSHSDKTSRSAGVMGNTSGARQGVAESHPAGRWPANVILDDNQAAALDAQSGKLKSGYMKPETDRATRQGAAYGKFSARTAAETYGDKGGASRFFYVTREEPCKVHEIKRCTICLVPAPDDGMDARFRYCAKAPKNERPVVNGVAHPTVKPLTLMRWLVRLVTPPGGTVLDPFAGSGTTIEACMLEGFDVIGIEREAEYLPLISARISRAAS